MKSAWLAVSLDIANKMLTLIAADSDKQVCKEKMEQRAVGGRLFNVTSIDSLKEMCHWLQSNGLSPTMAKITMADFLDHLKSKR